METCIVSYEAFCRGQAEKAAALLKAGQVVAFPTETVYGLGALALDERPWAKFLQPKGGRKTIR